MLSHLLRAIFRRIDRHIAAHVTAALDEPTLAHLTEPPTDYGYATEPTPIADAAWLAAIDRACRIEVACEEWAAEVDALADAELAEMTREGER